MTYCPESDTESATDRRFNEEIEITPEMIEAGCEAAGLFDRDDELGVFVAAIYRTMRETRLGRTPLWHDKVR